MKPHILRWDPEPGRRLLVVSDIHGNVPYFEGVLRKVGFSDRDELIIDGDFLEKGQESLRMLRILMELARRGNTHVLLGNCDDWYDLFRPEWDDTNDEKVLQYVLWRKSGLLWDMCNAAGIDPFDMGDFTAVKHRLLRAFPNLMCDISAGSGHNALTRDPDYTYRFLREFHERIVYGTDIRQPSDRHGRFIGTGAFLDEAYAAGVIGRTQYENIARNNALRLLEGRI